MSGKPLTVITTITVSYVYPWELHRFEVRHVMRSRPALQLQSIIELNALELLDSVAPSAGKQC